MRRVLGILIAALVLCGSAHAQEVADFTKIYLNGAPSLTSGSGSPEGAQIATPGSLHLRTDTGDWYRKASGTGNTGWVIATALSGSGTLNTITKWTGTATLGNSTITDDGTTLTLAAGGDIVLNPTGNDVLPDLNYDINLGMLSKKYLTLHAAELWVETLVAQNTIATIGGRVLVAQTNILTSDVTAGADNINVKYNNLSNAGGGDIIYFEADGKVEFMRVVSAGTGAGPYNYFVTRDLDGSGANAWYAGDAPLNTGVTGSGFIDLYSLRSIKNQADGGVVEPGPTIVGNVRSGTATYNDWSPRWAIGNLNGLYGYAATTYGAAFGVPTAAWIKIDPTNGIRIGHNATTKIALTAAGDASFTGTVTASAGALANWVINTDQINDTGGNLILHSGTAGNSYVLVSDAVANNAGLISGSAAGDIVLFAGGTFGNRATAPFRVTLGGAVTATSGAFTGTVTATGGAIGGWVVGADYVRDAASVVGMSSAVTGGDDIRFWAGHATMASAPFRVTEAGALTATSGAIGGFSLGSDYIRDAADSFGMASTVSGGDDVRFWAGDTFANRGSADFRVTESGAVTATNANITGTIDANSGYLGTLTVDGTLTVSGGSIVADAVTIDGSGLSLTAGTGTGNKIKWSDSTYIYSNSGGINLFDSANTVTWFNNSWVAASNGNLGTAGYEWGEIYADLTSGSGTPVELYSPSAGVMKLVFNSSSERFKENIHAWTADAESLVLKAKPIVFDYINGQRGLLGLSAEAMADISPLFVNYDQDGRPLSLKVTALITATIAALQAQNRRIEQLERQLGAAR